MKTNIIDMFRESRSYSEVRVTSGIASDEHPMSTRWASDGSRWKHSGKKEGNIIAQAWSMQSGQAGRSMWKYAAMLVMLFTLGIGQMWGVNWNKITNLSDLSDGDSVLVVLQNGNTLTAGKAVSVNGTTSANSADVTITSNSYISNPANNIKWAITNSDGSNYIIKSGTYYLGSGSETNNNIASNLDTPNSWYITKVSDGYFKLQFKISSGRYLSWKGSCYGKYATSNFRNQISTGTAFAQYDGAISFYKKESGYAVTYEDGGHGTAPSNTTASSVTLSAITATGWTCTGWKADVDVTNTSSETISAGTLIPNGTSVTLSQATTFTAQWETAKYTVSFGVSPAGYGTVSQASVTNVPHGTVPSSSTNTVTVNGTTVTATPHAQDADYNYAFSSWSGIPGSVTSAVTITANFTRTARTMTNYRTTCVACEEPTSVSVEGTNKYLGGQTISLTATPTGGTGTPSYRWQKKINGTWTNLANGGSISGATSNNLQISSCGYGNSGGYRCIVSTGEGCETMSHEDDDDGYGVHVFSIHGKYISDANYSDNEIAWTSGTTGMATIHMDAKKTYLFKVWSNNGYYYGHGVNANEDFMFQPTTWDCGVDNREMRLFTTVEGDYTFTVNIEHGLDGSPYVNLQVDYPSMTHPNTGYVYVQKFNWTPRLHYWYNNDNKLTEWNDDPSLASDQHVNICGTDYWCVPVIDYYCNFIAADHNGQTTGNQHTNFPHPEQRLYNDGSWKWGSFTTYTISYAGGEGGTGGPMAPNTGICLGSSQQLTANAFSKAYHTFNGWSDGNGHTYADQATITNIQNDITLTAQWTPEQYNITATLPNVTSTTSFPVAYTYTGSAAGLTYTFTAESGYCLPNDVTVSGSTYTWDKASGELTLTGVITSNVSITVTAVQAYTVTFVHHDKGTYSDGSTEWIVPSNDATITLPTVTSVDCGFYDTFEGWIASANEYAESTIAPASILAGGSSYTVSGDVTLRAVYSKCLGDQAFIYSKVTSAPTDWSGTYLIVHEGSSKAMNGNETQSNLTTTSNNVDVAIVDSKVASNSTTDTYTFTIVPHSTASGKYSIRSHSGYYIGSNSTSAAINATATETTYSNSISLTNGTLMIGCGTKNNNDKDFQLMFKSSGSGSPIFKYFASSESAVCLYEKQSLCTTYYATNPTCTLPAGVHINYNANDNDDATGTCSTQNRTYHATNGYPQLASVLDFCTNVTRDGYTLVGWNTQANGLGTTYNINQHYYNLRVSGELDGQNWVTLNLFAMWAPAVSFNLGNATGGTGVPAVVEADGGFMLPEPTAAQIGTIPCGYSFYGWSESSVSSITTKPDLFMPGTKYTGSYRTLYAVYRLAGEGGNPDLFSLSYTYSDTKYYVAKPTDITTAPSTWGSDKVKKFSATTDPEEALAFGTKSIGGKTVKSFYWMYDEEEVYVYWKDNAGSLTHANKEDTDYGWTISGTTDLTFSTTYPGETARQIVFTAPSYGDPATFNASTSAATNLHKEEASTTTYTYATSPTCYTTATLHFVTNGGTMNYPTSYTSANYEDLAVPTTVYLPTATFAGEWVFEGWMKGAPVSSQTEVPTGANFYPVTLNTTQYTASTVGETYFYAVFSKTNNDKQFDPVNGGTYKLFAILSDGTTKYYMPTWGGTQTTLDEVTTCASTGDYTITPGTGDHAGQYKITHSTYTLGVESDGTQFKNDANAWWNIEPSSSGKGTYRITIVGSSTRCMCYGGTGFFGNYAVSQVNNPKQTTYRDMEIGECIYTEYTSTPANIPYITITGSPVKITSTKGERVYSPTKVHIEAHNFTGERIIHLSATNGFGVDPSEVRTNSITGAFSGDVDVYYYPNEASSDGSIVSSVLTASQVAGTSAEQVSQTFTAIKGRNMPQDFVIAVKSGTQWYALPDDCHGSGTPAAVPIEVNDPNAPTAASLVPHNVEWRLSDVVSTRTDYRDKVYFYEPNTVKTTDPLTYYNYTLYAGDAPSIQTYAQLTEVKGDNSYHYEWTLTTSDLCAYTISNADVGKNISINTSGNFGTHTNNVVSDALYLLPITAYYEPAKMQVLEWKANSVVVMYTGTQTTATTKVGDNSASIAQTLSNQKLTHGIYELTTGQALTSNAGEALKVSFGGGAEMATVTVPIIINSEVTVSESHESQDVVIVSGGKLTAAATKYSFHNIYVYGGGKLKIASETSLGVNNIILRAGGISTDGAGGSATYEYVYPQVELGGTLTSTQTNIKYEYITDNDNWYHLCLPFNGTLNSITYPQEYYGNHVAADNKGSWEIDRYAGEVRATGNYNAWIDITSEHVTDVLAGHGYIYWGEPLELTIGSTTARQEWGIQRITMPTSATAASTAENADKTITGLGSYSGVDGNSGNANDQGWNLIGNPYMANLTGLTSESIKTGKLVEVMVDDKWTGRWENNNDGVRYVTIPTDHFLTYSAQPVTSFTEENPMKAGRAFFVQIVDDAEGVTFATAKRASLMPAWRRNVSEEQRADIETGIVMSSGSQKDEVNFWIKDGKTAEYEYNADYPKTMNSTNFNIYGVHSHGDLSWIAISPEIAEGLMAIGYQVPKAGEYELSLSDTYMSEDIEHVFVTDHGVNPEITTDLVDATYLFYVSQAETNNERFTVSIKLKDVHQTTTEMESISGEDNEPLKFIYQDKMYILRNGVIYDAVGKKVREIK